MKSGGSLGTLGREKKGMNEITMKEGEPKIHKEIR
jgi:hypothetical protein